jgi:periplasmic copper chaperone A
MKLLIGAMFALTLCACASAAGPSITLAGPAIVRNSPEAGADIQAAAYVRVYNSSSEADRLISLSCVCADDVQMHSTIDRSMHVLNAIDAPAKGVMEVKPGGPTHLMLMGVRAPISPGDRLTITLTFERAGPIDIEFTAVENSRDGWLAHGGKL